VTLESFVIILQPAPAYGTPNTDQIIDQHFAYLQSLQKDGVLLMAGRFSDVLVGLVIIEAKDRETALSIMTDDPAVKAGVFHAELHPWRIAIQRSTTEKGIGNGQQ
jgi:uncharacterized protein YciI